MSLYLFAKLYVNAVVLGVCVLSACVVVATSLAACLETPKSLHKRFVREGVLGFNASNIAKCYTVLTKPYTDLTQTLVQPSVIQLCLQTVCTRMHPNRCAT